MQQLGGVLFNQDPALKIQPRREAEVFVVRAGEAVDAAMAASPVRVDARVEADVGAVVAGDDRTRGVTQVDRLRSRLYSIRPLGLRLDLDPLEAILGIVRRPATDDASSIPLRLLHRLILTGPCLSHYAYYGRAGVRGWIRRVLQTRHPRRATVGRRHDPRPRGLDGWQACPRRRGRGRHRSLLATLLRRSGVRQEL